MTEISSYVKSYAKLIGVLILLLGVSESEHFCSFSVSSFTYGYDMAVTLACNGNITLYISHGNITLYISREEIVGLLKKGGGNKWSFICVISFHD